MIRTLLSILLVLSTSTQAAMVMPPDMRTEEDYKKFAEQMRNEMPSLVTYGSRLNGTLVEWARKIDALADRLKRSQDFLALSVDRPDPLAFMFYTYTEKREKTNGLNPDFVARTQEYFDAVYAEIYKESEERFIEVLKARILELSNAVAAQSFAGLTTGLAMVLPQDQRRDILGGRKGLEEKAHLLLAAIEKVTNDELRRIFQSERFGVPRASMDKIKAVEMLSQAVQREQELTSAISLLEVYNNGNLEDIDSEDVTWFTGDDMGGLEKDLPDLPKALIERMRSQARNSYSSVTQDQVIRTPQSRIIVKEVPPHLAVFRGCPGGDCSTSSSWAFPFSPKERDYYVYMAGNNIVELGYVSAAIVEVDGKPAFFIRDITGRKLAPDHVDMIIEGFAQMLPQLGVKKMTIASEEFTTAQNHFPRLISRINGVAAAFETVDQTFHDGRLRENILGKTPGSMGTYYDGAAAHSEARLYNAAKTGTRLTKIAAQLISPEEIASLPTGGDDEKLQLLIIGYLSNLKFFIRSANPTFTKWNEFKEALKNKSGLTVLKYFQNLEKYFKEFGLPLSKRLIEKAPDLFYEGQLNASNAFKGENAQTTFQMIVDRYVERRERSVLAKAGAHKDEFFASKPFQDLVKDIFTHRRPIDLERIYQIWSFGYQFEFEMDRDQRLFFLKGLERPVHQISQRQLVSTIQKYIDYGVPEQVPGAYLLKLSQSIPYHFYYSNQPAPIRALSLLSHFRFRNGDALARIRNIFKASESRLNPKFAAAMALISSDFEKPENIQTKVYFMVWSNLENNQIREELRNRGRELLAELKEANPEGYADLEARAGDWARTVSARDFQRECGLRVTHY